MKWRKGKTVVTALILVLEGLALFSGKSTVTFYDDHLVASTVLGGSSTVYYSDILEAKLVSNLDTGRRTFGFGSFTVAGGSFENDRFGAYKLYSYTGCDSYVVLDTVSGVIVFNGKTKEETKALYDALQEAMDP